jgi:hypothetical protein
LHEARAKVESTRRIHVAVVLTSPSWHLGGLKWDRVRVGLCSFVVGPTNGSPLCIFAGFLLFLFSFRTRKLTPAPKALLGDGLRDWAPGLGQSYRTPVLFALASKPRHEAPWLGDRGLCEKHRCSKPKPRPSLGGGGRASGTHSCKERGAVGHFRSEALRHRALASWVPDVLNG